MLSVLRRSSRQLELNYNSARELVPLHEVG